MDDSLEPAFLREQEIHQAHRLIAEDRGNPGAYITAARTCKNLGCLDDALGILRQGIDRCAPDLALHQYFIERLEKCNRTEEAIARAQSAMRLFPDSAALRLWEATILPMLYDSLDQIGHYRNRFAEGLERFGRGLRLATASERRDALETMATRVTMKYLPYQAENDLSLHQIHAGIVTRVMAANYPQWMNRLAMPPDVKRIRVGYLSARFSNMSATKLFSGWLREQDRERFEIFAYHADSRMDAMAQQVERLSLTFRQVSESIDQIAQAILQDRLHILVFLDIGMHPRMMQLAALRLAPIYCLAWDTPETSGMPNMDYFLSSELMEPPGAQGHYSETLVPLPGVGVCFPKPVIPTPLLTKSRADFGLRDASVVYLACQSVFKYLPAFDELVAEIARRVPDSQFVFLFTNSLVGADLRFRLGRAFATVGADIDNHCVFLPEMPALDFWNLNVLADVSLDTLGWSGGVSTLEAVACGLPVATVPGGLMRGRHSYGILTQLGVTETIARDRPDYVEIAVRLGTDREWRRGIVQRMAAGFSRLYSDTRSVRALEDFLQRVVEERFAAEARRDS